MHISLDKLSPHIRQFIQTQLKEGKYQCVEELIDAALTREANKHDTLHVRPTADSDDAELERINEINRRLSEAGLLSEFKPMPDPNQKRDFTPIRIDGPPLSQTIIEERR